MSATAYVFKTVHQWHSQDGKGGWAQKGHRVRRSAQGIQGDFVDPPTCDN